MQQGAGAAGTQPSDGASKGQMQGSFGQSQMRMRTATTTLLPTDTPTYPQADEGGVAAFPPGTYVDGGTIPPTGGNVITCTRDDQRISCSCPSCKKQRHYIAWPGGTEVAGMAWTGTVAGTSVSMMGLTGTWTGSAVQWSDGSRWTTRTGQAGVAGGMQQGSSPQSPTAAAATPAVAGAAPAASGPAAGAARV
jgi:hypothetical protein